MVMWVWSGFLGMAKALHCFLLRWLAFLSVAHRPVGTIASATPWGGKIKWPPKSVAAGGGIIQGRGLA